MARYNKRRRGYRRNSTNIIKMKFQSFMDISTDVDSMKIIQISAGGKHLLERCPLQFGAYKYYKIGNISVKLVPASTLPADPTGLSYTVGDNATIDPRDQLSPGLMRITNGEDIFTDLTGVSDDAQHKIYNSMMLDPRWFKWMLQRGVKRHATPRYWQIGQLHQDKWPGSVVNIPEYDGDGSAGTIKGTASEHAFSTATGGVEALLNVEGSSPYGFFQTGHRGILGWLPTDGLQPVPTSSALVDKPFIASPAEVNVFTLVLPKAYKTRYYYRAFISETVYFKEPIVSVSTEPTNFYAPLDIFHRMMLMNPDKPTTSVSNQVYDSRTGGNYGDD